MDIVYIKELQIQTIIGIFDWERETKQTISIDLEMGCNIKPAAQSDSIEDALDYKSVSKRIISFVEQSEFQLVETMAERIAEIILNEYRVPWLKLRLGKPGALRGSTDVGILIERGCKDKVVLS